MEDVSLEPGGDEIVLKPGQRITIQIADGRFIRVRAVADREPDTPTPAPEGPWRRPIFDPGVPPDKIMVFVPRGGTKNVGTWLMSEPGAVSDRMGHSVDRIWKDDQVTHYINVGDFT